MQALIECIKKNGYNITCNRCMDCFHTYECSNLSIIQLQCFEPHISNESLRKARCIIARLKMRLSDAWSKIKEKAHNLRLRCKRVKRFDKVCRSYAIQHNQIRKGIEHYNNYKQAYNRLREFLIIDNPYWIPTDTLGSGFDMRYNITTIDTV